MKNNSFLVTIILALSFNNLNCGQAGSRPILDPLDLLKFQPKQKEKRRPKKKPLSLQKNQSGLPVQLPVPKEYELCLQPPCDDYTSDNSSVDNFYQDEVPTASTPTVQTAFHLIKDKITVIVRTITVAAASPIKRDVPLVCSDDFLDNTEDSEDRLDSPESEQAKRYHPEAFKKTFSHFLLPTTS